MTAPVEVEINAPTVEVETPSADTGVSTVELDHERRITQLETAVAVLSAATVEAQNTAETAVIDAEIAQETASAAMEEAIQAEIVADSVGDAVEAIAETTETQEDDVIAEEVIIEPDVPARRPNIMFDERPFDRLKK